MSKGKMTPLEIEKNRDHTARVLVALERTSLRGKARIYVDFLKDGYIFKPLEARHEEMLDNFTEDKTAAFVEMMLNSSRPVSSYDTLVKVAPHLWELSSRQRLIDSSASLGATLAFKGCACTTRHQAEDYCLFRKLSYWDNRKLQKELSRRGII